jgi:hypothetical protein
VLARARAAAIATTPTHVYFGDEQDDALLALAKDAPTGTEPTRIARRAPRPGALVATGGSLVWIGNPGDVVLRAGVEGVDVGEPTTLRDRGTFTDVAAAGDDVFIAEQTGAGGALTRITGATAARLATLSSAPRALVVGDEHAYVVTPTRILRVPRQRGEVATLAEGTAFGAAALDRDGIYVTAKRGATRAIVRVSTTGGPTVDVVDGGVRDAPITIFGGEIHFFDEKRPAILARSLAGGSVRIVTEDPVLARPTALAVDATGTYAATDDGRGGVVVRARPAKR